MGKVYSIKSLFQKSLLSYNKAIRIYEYTEQLAPKEKLGDIHGNIGRMGLIHTMYLNIIDHRIHIEKLLAPLTSIQN